MKKLYLYLESIPRSKRQVLQLALLSMALFPLLANLLFTSPTIRELLNNQVYLLGLGVLVYGAWLWVLYSLKKKDILSWKHLSLNRPDIKKGLVLGLALYLIVQAAIIIKVLLNGGNLTPSNSFSSFDAAIAAIGVFAFNIFVGAFIEEILNRAYLIPQVYKLLSKKIKYKALALVLALLATQVFFALMHLPGDLLRFDANILSLSTKYEQLFISGLMLALVYLRTRNVLFVSMYHAFLNYGLPIVLSDAYLKLHYNVVVLLLLLFWNRILKTKATETRLEKTLVAC